MARPRKERVRTTADLLSTGSTWLDLICSGKIKGGIPKGTIVHLPGSSDSGKSVLGMTAFAEANNSLSFDGYDFLYKNPEDNQLPIEWYGKTYKRIEESQPESLDEFYFDLHDRLEANKPFIMLLDSMDALFPKAWLKKMTASKRKAAKGEEGKGDMGMQKAKMNSEHLRKVRTGLVKTGSILIIISQTRDNPMDMFNPQTVSGGKAIKYFSTLQIWLNSVGTVTKSYKGVKYPTGIVCRADVKKNHLTGRKGRATFPILNDIGIDNLGSCTNFLVGAKHWKSSGKDEEGKVTAPEFFDGAVTREKLFKLIEKEEREKELKLLVKEVFNEIDERTKSGRKRRYE